MKTDDKLELASNWKNNGFYFHCRNYHPHEHRHLNLHHVLEGMENDFNYFTITSAFCTIFMHKYNFNICVKYANGIFCF